MFFFGFVPFALLKEEKKNRLRASRYKNEGEHREEIFFQPFDEHLVHLPRLHVSILQQPSDCLRSNIYFLLGFVSQKTVYLFVYNLVQFLGFSWIFVNMTVRLVIFGQGEMTSRFLFIFILGNSVSRLIWMFLSSNRFSLRHVSLHVGCDVLLPDPGSR